jgi:hypothetical protein
MRADDGWRVRGANQPENLRKRAEHYRRLAGAASDPKMRDLYTQMAQLIAERAELARQRRIVLEETPFERK